MGEEKQVEMADTEPTFAEAKGTEANQAAKKAAREKKHKEQIEKMKKSGEYYSLKGDKLLKYIAKPGKVFSVYVGSMKKHGDALKPLIVKWKAAGVWLGQDEVQEKMGKIQAELTAKFEAKSKKA